MDDVAHRACGAFLKEFMRDVRFDSHLDTLILPFPLVDSTLEPRGWFCFL